MGFSASKVSARKGSKGVLYLKGMCGITLRMDDAKALYGALEQIRGYISDIRDYLEMAGEKETCQTLVLYIPVTKDGLSTRIDCVRESKDQEATSQSPLALSATHSYPTFSSFSAHALPSLQFHTAGRTA
jgi:hypothetical protein